MSVKRLLRPLHCLKKHRNRPYYPYLFRPFTLSELQPVPKGWDVGGPQYVGVGFGKAGTTWWHTLLLSHPQITGNRLRVKELHYFIHFRYRGLRNEDIALYRQAFAAPPGSISGEWSSYLMLPFCIEYLAQAAPKAKILVLLRNPVDRALSVLNETAHFYANFFDLTEEQKRGNETNLTYPIAIERNLYAYRLNYLLKHFPREQVLVLQYEKCVAKPDGEISRTYRFLGVDDAYRPQNTTQMVNKKDYLIPLATQEERQRLAYYFEEDVRSLKGLCPEVDTTLWSDFAS